MEKNCFNCKYFDQPSFEMKEFCWECLRREELYTRWERKPITNADRIRAMSDEELDKLLWNIRNAERCVISDQKRCIMFDDCIACWLDWLRQEG